MNSIPRPASAVSSASKYSWVAPGPPCSNSSLIRGLLPNRLVHTLKSPLAVWIGIIRTPPACGPGSVGAKYPARVGPPGAPEAHAASTRAQVIARPRSMVSSYFCSADGSCDPADSQGLVCDVIPDQP